jgi:hypothetical protein
MSYAAEVPTVFGLVAAVLNLHHVPTKLGVGRFFRCVGRPWGRGYGWWSRISMSYSAGVIPASGLAAAILNIDHLSTELGVRRCSIVSSVLEKIDMAVGVTFLCHIRPRL